MSVAPIEINLELKNQKVKFVGVSASNQDNPITIDYLPPLGDGEGFLGLELLVMSFAGCVSTAIVGLLRRQGKNISSYKMKAAGIKKETPLSLEKISFEITIESDNTNEDELIKTLKMAGDISPVWIAIKNNVEVVYDYKLLNSAQ